jgi:DNA-directed RNA polymerase specialized sigma subunit
MSAKEIADKLKIDGTAAYVRISQIKRDAINKLIDNVDPAQVVDLL